MTALDASNPLHVISNYMNIGALWVTDPTKPATSTPDFLNQRGSMQLENPVMETVFQGTLNLDSITKELHASTGPTTGALNCFTCHAYTPNKTASTGLSHIYSSIVKQASTSATD